MQTWNRRRKTRVVNAAKRTTAVLTLFVILSSKLSVFLRSPVQLYYKSCKDVKEHIPDSLSGLYTIQPVPDGQIITAYCEMAIAGGGFTFVPRSAIRENKSQHLTQALFTDRSRVLMRIQKKDGTQPYTLVEQLPEYKQYLLGARVNNYDGYTSPQNSYMGDYLFLGNKTLMSTMSMLIVLCDVYVLKKCVFDETLIFGKLIFL